MKTTTLELEEESRLHTEEDPEAPPETSVLDQEEKPDAAVDHEEIARRAYEHWQRRGCPQGSPEVDWYQAEGELRRRAG